MTTPKVGIYTNILHHPFSPISICIGGSRGGATGLAIHPPPFQISKIKESNKTKQKIEDNPLEKEEERKSCMFV